MLRAGRYGMYPADDVGVIIHDVIEGSGIFSPVDRLRHIFESVKAVSTFGCHFKFLRTFVVVGFSLLVCRSQIQKIIRARSRAQHYGGCSHRK